MKTLIGTIIFFILSFASFGQSQVPYSYLETARLIVDQKSNTFHTYNDVARYPLSPTFSNVHAMYTVSPFTMPNKSVLGNTVWGGIVGMAFGASIVLADNPPDFRPKAHDVIVFSALGAGVGFVSGLMVGIIKNQRLKK